jgi:hypothetical protein
MITAPAATAMLAPLATPHISNPLHAPWITLAVLALILLYGLKKESRRYVWISCFLLLVLFQTACTSATNSNNSGVQPSSRSYMVTVTGASSPASSTAVQHSTQVTVIVP